MLNNDAAELSKLQRLIGKMSLAVGGRLHNKLVNDGKRGWDSNASVEELVANLKRAVEHGRWIDVAAFAAFLWHREWREHLGRDFLLEGEEPEHCTSAGI